MSSPPENPPVMIIAVVGLLIAATVVLCLVRLPLPLRIAIAGIDVIAALVVFALSRQQR